MFYSGKSDAQADHERRTGQTHDALSATAILLSLDGARRQLLVTVAQPLHAPPSSLPTQDRDQPFFLYF